MFVLPFYCLIFYQKWQHNIEEGNVSLMQCESILSNPSEPHLCLKTKLFENYSDKSVGSKDCWSLYLFVLFASRKSRNGSQHFNSALVHRDSVCGGITHASGSDRVLCDENQGWQICRYATDQGQLPLIRKGSPHHFAQESKSKILQKGIPVCFRELFSPSPALFGNACYSVPWKSINTPLKVFLFF